MKGTKRSREEPGVTASQAASGAAKRAAVAPTAPAAAPADDGAALRGELRAAMLDMLTTRAAKGATA
ncbi:hypothetical protein HYH03_009269 [Edaphochlamys debaryana]|uniref:Uncharacterized protein n=1 Tax=Edaphochlamys debaryana TaxID=47281 RepID=A0A835XY22_9CHLO|nr:hypothetical protein HYH03_009269 [Edaphochlamys debaryana]|eukprot:KAG2492318.1 hypothetical protein HYH03_009269 [Edaphochlamys debaryana]